MANEPDNCKVTLQVDGEDNETELPYLSGIFVVANDLIVNRTCLSVEVWTLCILEMAGISYRC